MKRLLLLLIFPCIMYAEGPKPKPYITTSYEARNGHVFLVTTRFIPSVKIIKVPVQKSYYRRGRLIGQKVEIQKKTIVVWKKKINRRKIH